MKTLAIEDKTSEAFWARTQAGGSPSPAAPASAREVGTLHRGMSREDYDALGRVNWTTLKEMGRSPAHYLHKLREKDEDSDARKFGRAVHLAVLEPDEFAARVVVWSDGTRRGKAWDSFAAEHAAQEILTSYEYRECVAIRDAVRASATAAAYLSAAGESELSIAWTHRVEPVQTLPGWEIRCKGRLDWVTRDAIVDLKTCRDASPSGFGRAAWDYQLHVQAAMYVDGYAAATGIELPYVLVAVEKSAPYAVTVFRVPDVLIELGRDTYHSLLAKLKACQDTNQWPGYVDGECDLTLPRWAIPPDDDDAADLGLVIGG